MGEYEVKLMIDGVNVHVSLDSFGDVVLALGGAEASHFTPTNVELIIMALVAAIEAKKDELK